MCVCVCLCIYLYKHYEFVHACKSVYILLYILEAEIMVHSKGTFPEFYLINGDYAGQHAQ